ncbi:Translation initiation factor eIF-2B subunit delta [Phytophthora fragariae]|uniref:Translation initiation factor eIF2B subunit delta n=1 Tax=Phytophthora fragariae TaxID=53985 RepID=A0A6A3EDY4_9STRA|nr:Translation initiation factor eIF-2B subunit delta [Phytophthora fragariae]KAE8930031.1 Translation initiation factor eIF-2B subunit delta [Phytophthora fragariae]KAE9028882.1 Translation initiation factor eIF-2B subunit delta [Phytophthora fragariae]KAE9089877.1 Translation initiation factor eIF-2B subunit delta [Phytophthora fragariae]KAE9121345.1 Translation initiation factor eIF-2B subunit delta [Phytophthora fragariae]
MADSRSPVLEPGADLKHLESMLDGKNQKKRGKKAVEPYQGKLEGWSPAAHHEDDAVPPMEKLSLGPAAADKPQEAAATNDKKPLSKAERKKLAAEAFAKAGGVPKREKLSKAERRAQQEASRQKKEPKKADAAGPTAPTPTNVRLQYDDAKKMARRSKAAVVVRTQAQKQVEMFSHLPQYERESSLSLNVGFSNKEEVHAAVLALGLKYAEGKISGGNARCIAMITAFKEVIDDYVTPPDKQLGRDLDKRLRPLIQYLIDCRPHGIGMGNAIRRLRRVIGSTPPELSEEEAKRRIRDEMDDYVQSRILLASRAVVKNAQSKISAGDVILTYARANVVEELLLETAKTSPEIAATLRVIVVDSRPHYEGRKLVSVLAGAGLQCSYLQINALSYIMREVTKVFLGAAAFMSNGVAVARVGTALVAMTAHEANVPVLFCCETYKFSDRVQLDAITHNELGDPDELVSSYCTDKSRSRRRAGDSASGNASSGSSNGHVLSDWRDLADLKLLNLVYDVTPIDYVSMVVTELGMIPPTSIPAVLREYSRDGLADGAL